MLVTTNLRFADWTQVFGDERLTAALLYRLTHKAHILEFTGESYRFRQRMQREVEERDKLSVGTMYMSATVTQTSNICRVASTACLPMKVGSWMDTAETIAEYLIVLMNSLPSEGRTCLTVPYMRSGFKTGAKHCALKPRSGSKRF